MQIGVFLPNWIGDTVMATPALRALCKHFGPAAHLVGVLRPHLADVLAGTAWLDEQIFFDPRSADSKLRSWSIANQLRVRRLDTLLLLTNSFRSGLIACASGARRRVGYVRYGRGLMLTTRLYPPCAGRKLIPTPAIDSYLKLAYVLGCPAESPRLELATTPADEQATDAIWRKLRLPAGEEVVVLNSGGAYGAAKHWPAEYFAQLARRIAMQDKLAVLVNCGPGERQIAAEIVPRRRSSGRGRPGRRGTIADRSDQGLHSSQPAFGQHRQRPALFRRGLRPAGGNAFRPDSSGLEPDTRCRRDMPGARRPLRAVHEAHLPAGPSSLHARIDGGCRLSSGRKAA